MALAGVALLPPTTYPSQDGYARIPSIEEKRVSPKDLVGVAEIAERAGVTPDAIHKWRYRHPETFPQPVAELSQGPVWDWLEVRGWLKARSSKARTGTRSEHPSDAGEEKRPERS